MADDIKPQDKNLSLKFGGKDDSQWDFNTKVAYTNHENLSKARLFEKERDDKIKVAEDTIKKLEKENEVNENEIKNLDAEIAKNTGFDDKIKTFEDKKAQVQKKIQDNQNEIKILDAERKKNEREKKTVNPNKTVAFFEENLRQNYGAEYDKKFELLKYATTVTNDREKNIARVLNANIVPKTVGEFKGSHISLSENLENTKSNKALLEKEKTEMDKRMGKIIDLLLETSISDVERKDLMNEQAELNKRYPENSKLLKDLTLDEKMYNSNIANLEKNFKKTLNSIDKDKLEAKQKDLEQKKLNQENDLRTLVGKKSKAKTKLEKEKAVTENEIEVIKGKLKFYKESKGGDIDAIKADDDIKKEPSPYEAHATHSELISKAMRENLQQMSDKMKDSKGYQSFEEFKDVAKSNTIINAYIERNARGIAFRVIEKVTGVNTRDFSNKVQNFFGVDVASKQERRDMQNLASMYDALHPNEKHSNGEQVLGMMGLRDGKTYKSVLEVDPYELHKFKASLLQEELKDTIVPEPIKRQVNDASETALEEVEKAANKVNFDNPPSYEESQKQAHAEAKKIGQNAIHGQAGGGQTQTQTQTPQELIHR